MASTRLYACSGSHPSRDPKVVRQRARARTVRYKPFFCSTRTLIQLHRIAQLEMLDEVEELDLVLAHYAITWGLKVYGNSVSAPWAEWGLKEVVRSEEDD